MQEKVGGRGGFPFMAKGAGEIPVGRAIVTSAYALPSEIIIHAVVPRWRGGRHGEYDLLCEAYLSVLTLADETSCESLAIPMLASGHNHFDADLATKVAIKSIEEYQPKNKLKDVTLVTYDSSITQRMRDLGYPVEEFINERYVQENDEECRPAPELAMAVAKDAAQDFVDQAIAIGDALLDDPAVQKKLKEWAFQIVDAVVKEAADAAKEAFKK